MKKTFTGETGTHRATSLLFATAAIAVALVASAPAFAQTKHPSASAEQNQKELMEEIKALRAQVERLQKTVDQREERSPGMQGGGMKGGGMEHRMGGMGGGGMKGGMMEKEHQMEGMGAGASPTPAGDSAHGPAGAQKPGMQQHMEDMHKHMGEMHGGGTGSPASAPTAPPSEPSGGMMDDM